MKAILVVVLTLCSLCSFSQTDSSVSESKWILTSGSKVGDFWFIRNKYENKENGLITIWVKCVIKSIPYKGKTLNFAEEKLLITVNCVSKTYRENYVTLTDKDGELIYQSDGDMKWTVVIPDSAFEGLVQKICEHFEND